MSRLHLVLFVLFVGIAGCLTTRYTSPDGNLQVGGAAGANAAVGVMDAASRNTATEASIKRCDELLTMATDGSLPPGSVVRCQDTAGGIYVGPANTVPYTYGYTPNPQPVNGTQQQYFYGYTGPPPPRTVAAQQYSALYREAEAAKRQLEASERQRLETEIQLRQAQEAAARRAAEQSADDD